MGGQGKIKNGYIYQVLFALNIMHDTTTIGCTKACAGEYGNGVYSFCDAISTWKSCGVYYYRANEQVLESS